MPARKRRAGMGDGRGCVCPVCASTVSSVEETRPHGGRVFRRRLCRCGFDYTTAEEVIDRGLREMIKPLTFKKVRRDT